MSYPYISGFADEICLDFRQQLQALTKMGMNYICIRTASGKNIAEFTPDEARDVLLPVLKEFNVRVSSLGSPIGKIGIRDEAAFELQMKQLENLCQVCHILDCRYIRVFSFYVPQDEDPAIYRDEVMAKLKQFEALASRYDVILLHENEKDIYGDTGARCLDILESVTSPHFAAAFDFANFVQCQEDPEVCWNMLKKYVSYIHIKDAVYSTRENVLCGTGDGKLLPILKDAFENSGYHGFLTLEPHLVIFSSLSTLEKGNPHDVVLKNKFSSGEEGYQAQYEALLDILKQINLPEV